MGTLNQARPIDVHETVKCKVTAARHDPADFPHDHELQTRPIDLAAISSRSRDCDFNLHLDSLRLFSSSCWHWPAAAPSARTTSGPRSTRRRTSALPPARPPIPSAICPGGRRSKIRFCRSLIGIALTNNYDLKQAVARVEQARNQVIAARSPLFPQIDYNGDIGRGRNAAFNTPAALNGDGRKLRPAQPQRVLGN